MPEFLSISSRKLAAGSSSRAFTLVELLSTIAIIAVLAVVATVYIGNYIQEAQNISSKQTLRVLNDALTRYKTQGGDINALTLGAPISRVLSLMQTPVTWAGMGHQFLSGSMTYPAASLEAVGERQYYRFFQLGDYTEDAPAEGTPTTAYKPYGDGVGYMKRTDEWGATRNFLLRSTTGSVAYQIDGGAVTIVSGTAGTDRSISMDIGSDIKFWSCTSGDSTLSGDITLIGGSNLGATELNVQALSGLTTLSLYSSDLVNVDLSENTALTYIELGYNYLESLDVSGLAALDALYVRDNLMTSLNVSGCTSLREFYCGGNSITSLDLTGLSAVEEFYCNDNNITSLDLSDMSSVWDFKATNNNLTSLNVANVSSLYYIYVEKNPNLGAIDITGLSSLYELDLDCGSYVPGVMAGISDMWMNVPPSNTGCTLPSDRYVDVMLYDLSLAQMIDVLNAVPVTTYSSELNPNGSENLSDSSYLAAVAVAEGRGWVVNN